MTISELLSHAVTTKDFVCEPYGIERLPELIRTHLSPKNGAVSDRGETARTAVLKEPPVRLIADDNTWEAAGRHACTVLEVAGFSVDPLIFPGRPMLNAEYSRITFLKDQLKDRSGPVLAVGSGTLNDITKQACCELNRIYGVFATAASMDGYCSQGAAIVKDGLKQVLTCAAPVFVVSCPAVLGEAPPEMNGSGYGDLAAKRCAGLDWMLADRLGADAIDPVAWKMVFDSLEDKLARAGDIGRGDRDAVSALFEGLASTGFALQYYGGSRPASGTEHQFSHVLEMEGWQHDGVHPSHGFKVGVGSLAVLKCYEHVLDYLLTSGGLPAPGSREAEVWLAERTGAYPDPAAEGEEARRLYGDSPGLKSILEVVAAKRPKEGTLRRRLEKLLSGRQAIAAELHAAMPVYEVFRGRLNAAGAPSAAADIGLTPEKTARTLRAARLIRKRYGILDLAYELGILKEVCDRVVCEI